MGFVKRELATADYVGCGWAFGMVHGRPLLATWSSEARVPALPIEPPVKAHEQSGQ